MERGRAVGFGRVHVSPLVDQGDGRGLVSRFDRIHQRRSGSENEHEDRGEHCELLIPESLCVCP
jgi:hypothetical protein